MREQRSQLSLFKHVLKESRFNSKAHICVAFQVECRYISGDFLKVSPCILSIREAVNPAFKFTGCFITLQPSAILRIFADAKEKVSTDQLASLILFKIWLDPIPGLVAKLIEKCHSFQ